MIPPSEILVLGGGIAGLAAALGLSKSLSAMLPDLKITVYELHEIPSTSGGAINLTPVAQRHLDQLGVLRELDAMGPDGGVAVNGIEIFSSHTGRRLGCVDFSGRAGAGYGGYRARRVMRISLHLAMLAAARNAGNIDLEFGKKVVGGVESEKRVTIFFADGSKASGDLALGCDGVHSQTRMKLVDPSTPSEYTGISFIQTMIKASQIKSPFHFETTAMNRSLHGSLLTTFCDRDREDIFVAALAEIKANDIQNGTWNIQDSWRPRSTPMKALRDDVYSRFADSALPCVREIVSAAANWTLYPVYQLAPGGKWHTERVLLLGDAAHAMPPRDESAAFALDDAILFSRILSIYVFHPLVEAFETYEALRRKPVTEAYDASCATWKQNKDKGRWANRLEEWLTPWNMYRRRKARSGAWEFDASGISIPLPKEPSFDSTDDIACNILDTPIYSVYLMSGKMALRTWHWASLMMVGPAAAVFNAYSLYDHGAVTRALEISSQCLAALNFTVDCDPDYAARAAKDLNDEYWSMDDIQKFCTGSCKNSLSTWLAKVEDNCAGEQASIDGTLVDPRLFPLRYITGYETTCLQDQSQKWCFFESQSWDKNACTGWNRDLEACSRGMSPLRSSKDGSYQPNDDFDMVPVTDIYERDLYCSDCFLLLWRQRLLSPFLPAGKIRDYLSSQLSNLIQICASATTSGPPITQSSASPEITTGFLTASHTSDTLNVHQNALRAFPPFYSTAIPAAPTQPGTVEACGQYYYVVSGDTCNSLAVKFGMDVGELRAYNTLLGPECENLWANYAICVAPISRRPMAMDGNCGRNNPEATCNGSPFGSCCSEGRCQPCTPTASTTPSPKTPQPTGSKPVDPVDGPKDGPKDDNPSKKPPNSDEPKQDNLAPNDPEADDPKTDIPKPGGPNEDDPDDNADEDTENDDQKDADDTDKDEKIEEDPEKNDPEQDDQKERPKKEVSEQDNDEVILDEDDLERDDQEDAPKQEVPDKDSRKLIKPPGNANDGKKDDRIGDPEKEAPNKQNPDKLKDGKPRNEELKKSKPADKTLQVDLEDETASLPRPDNSTYVSKDGRLSKGTVDSASHGVVLEIVPRVLVKYAVAASLLTARVGHFSQEAKHVKGRNLEIAVRSMDIVAPQRNIVAQNHVILGPA
ncbi:hypothetical protein FQN57_001712 [Myotisia sp. PD_48]|nr:hypothetical protein FQN57_001712 [Myotisia sp. PD_48]